MINHARTLTSPVLHLARGEFEFLVPALVTIQAEVIHFLLWISNLFYWSLARRLKVLSLVRLMVRRHLFLQLKDDNSLLSLRSYFLPPLSPPCCLEHILQCCPHSFSP